MATGLGMGARDPARRARGTGGAGDAGGERDEVLAAIEDGSGSRTMGGGVVAGMRSSWIRSPAGAGRDAPARCPAYQTRPTPMHMNMSLRAAVASFALCSDVA